jgi:hypothetical protein
VLGKDVIPTRREVMEGEEMVTEEVSNENVVNLRDDNEKLLGGRI